MKPASNPGPGGREAPASRNQADTRTEQTPDADLQGEDAGTAASGNGGRSTATQAAMKQQSKTDSERGSGG